MIQLDTPVQFIQGVGPKLAEKLSKLGINSAQDFLFHYPRYWEDFQTITKISEIKKGELYTLKARIVELYGERSTRKKMFVLNALLEDESGEISCVWFNQPFLKKTLKAGQEYIFRGRAGWNFQRAIKFLNSPQIATKPGILARYRETSGLTSKYLRKIIHQVLPLTSSVIDWLPDEIKQRQNLASLDWALWKIHSPSSFSEVQKARERLSFDELFLITLQLLLAKKNLQRAESVAIPLNAEFLKEFSQSLPFELTAGQKKSVWEAVQDMNRKVPMNRLVQGDVGSGKTIVGAMAAALAIREGYQAVWMAPTEILASQHYQTLQRIYKKFKFSVDLLTSSRKKADLASDMVVGTHALIQSNTHFPRLGLIIIDEQHRFGVEQRMALREKSNFVPHLISMTATPIPRTLALSLYGDLDISVITSLPKGRKKIETKIIPESERLSAYDFMREEIKQGRQAFVICPLVEEKKEEDTGQQLFTFVDEKKAVKSEYEKLSGKIFPEFKVGVLYGKMKAQEKQSVMDEFAQGKVQILVASSVIEVGIDVPNATVMMIEGAERFGLAQLHQFRGRVGRGEHQSYCLLLSGSEEEKAMARLQALVESEDGFALSERDLQLRGPGEFYGVRQSGFPDLKMASLSDTILVKSVREEAEKIVNQIDQYPELKKRVEKAMSDGRLE